MKNLFVNGVMVAKIEMTKFRHLTGDIVNGHVVVEHIPNMLDITCEKPGIFAGKCHPGYQFFAGNEDYDTGDIYIEM